MSEEIMRPKKEASVKLGTFVLLIILVAIAFGGAGFLYGQRTLITKSTASKTATATAISSATSSTTAVSSATSDETANWKTYTNDEIGFSFKYPSNWREPNLVKQDNIGGLPGTLYATSTASGPIYLDSGKIFSLLIVSNDYRPYGGANPITVKIDPNWTEQQYKDNILKGTGNASDFYKKLSDKAALVVGYTNIECSPSLGVEVLTPLATKYPNLEIMIHGGYDEDQIIKDAEATAQKNGTDTCDMESEYTKVAQKVVDGTFSEKVNQAIQIATKIANSVQVK